MSTTPINPMPFEDPDNPGDGQAEVDDPLYESGDPDPDETPDEEDPDDQLPRG